MCFLRQRGDSEREPCSVLRPDTPRSDHGLPPQICFFFKVICPRQLLQAGKVASLVLLFILEKGPGLPATCLSVGVPCHLLSLSRGPSLHDCLLLPHLPVQKTSTKEKDLFFSFKAFIGNYKRERECNRASETTLRRHEVHSPSRLPRS